MTIIDVLNSSLCDFESTLLPCTRHLAITDPIISIHLYMDRIIIAFYLVPAQRIRVCGCVSLSNPRIGPSSLFRAVTSAVELLLSPLALKPSQQFATHQKILISSAICHNAETQKLRHAPLSHPCAHSPLAQNNHLAICNQAFAKTSLAHVTSPILWRRAVI